MVVKLLDDAIRDADHIYGTVSVFSLAIMSGVRACEKGCLIVCFREQVLGTGVNSAGSAAPVHAPVAEAQKEAMQRAFAQTNKSPKDVDFVELHGTGKRSTSKEQATRAKVFINRHSRWRSHRGKLGWRELPA